MSSCESVDSPIGEEMASDDLKHETRGGESECADEHFELQLRLGKREREDGAFAPKRERREDFLPSLDFSRTPLCRFAPPLMSVYFASDSLPIVEVRVSVSVRSRPVG
ncbi:hypothetical protein Aduo_008143 [Ancylostoma duodenale]